MRKRLAKKMRQKTDCHIAYCKHFGIPIILDESSKWKRKHCYRLRAMMERHKANGLSVFSSALPLADPNEPPKPSCDTVFTASMYEASERSIAVAMASMTQNLGDAMHAVAEKLRAV